MKSKYWKSLLGISIGMLLIGTSTYAMSNSKIQEETTEAYQKWQNLSTEEKAKYIEPAPYGLDIDDSVRLSVFHKFTRGVGSTNTETAYNLYDDVKFTIKDQQDTDECWAFVTTTAIETNVEKIRNKKIELSPRHIDYATSRTFTDGINQTGYNRKIGFGNFHIALGYCMSGKGPVLESDMPFENNKDKIALSQINQEPAVKVEDYVQFATIYKKYSEDGTSVQYTNGATREYTEAQVNGVRELIKQHVKQYGGVMANVRMGADLLDCLNIEKIQEGTANTIAFCSKDSNSLFNHAVTIIGWDDNYSKENFNEKNKPQKDGAYLVVNTSAGENKVLSIMYISYEDVWIEYNNFGIVATSDMNYDNLYQYDEYGYNAPVPLKNNATGETIQTAYVANVFSREKTEKEEYLKEVAVHVSKTCNVDIYANTEGNDKTKMVKVASAGILEPGYHTVKLATPLKLTGDDFVVSAKLTADDLTISTETKMSSNGGNSDFWDYATAEPGQSFLSEDGNNWSDLNTMLKDSNVCIKAYTTYQEKEKNVAVTGVTLNKTKVEMQEGEALNLVATITPNDATNKNITWTSSDETVATISKTGIITAIKVGTTTITATTEDGNKTATCTITVTAKTNQDDDVYYEGNKPEQGESNIKDTTTATGTIPQTGIKMTMGIVIVLIIGTITIVYIKIRKMKDIK